MNRNPPSICRVTGKGLRIPCSQGLVCRFSPVLRHRPQLREPACIGPIPTRCNQDHKCKYRGRLYLAPKQGCGEKRHRPDYWYPMAQSDFGFVDWGIPSCRFLRTHRRTRTRPLKGILLVVANPFIKILFTVFKVHSLQALLSWLRQILVPTAIWRRKTSPRARLG